MNFKTSTLLTALYNYMSYKKMSLPTYNTGFIWGIIYIKNTFPLYVVQDKKGLIKKCKNDILKI